MFTKVNCKYNLLCSSEYDSKVDLFYLLTLFYMYKRLDKSTIEDIKFLFTQGFSENAISEKLWVSIDKVAYHCGGGQYDIPRPFIEDKEARDKKIQELREQKEAKTMSYYDRIYFDLLKGNISYSTYLGAFPID